MLRVQFKSVSHEFVYPFTTAHGLKTHQPALWIAMSTSGVPGIMGFGEAPAIHYYQVSVDSMIEELTSKMSVLESYAFTEPERFWHFCHHLFSNQHFLICALDMAYWDLYAKFKRKKIYEIMGIEWKEGPLTDYTLGVDTTDMMIRKLRENPWPVYKIKMSSPDEIDTIRQLRKETNALFRIDANASWKVDDAMLLIPELKKLGVEFVEQPLAKDQWEAMQKLKQVSVLPLYADESCVTEDDVLLCANSFHGINIKLTKCGGLTPALRMIQQARQLEMKVMMGCMNETEIGSYAIAQFLPLLDAVDMDGPLLLKNASLHRLSFDQGRVSILS